MDPITYLQLLQGSRESNCPRRGRGVSADIFPGRDSAIDIDAAQRQKGYKPYRLIVIIVLDRSSENTATSCLNVPPVHCGAG